MDVNRVKGVHNQLYANTIKRKYYRKKIKRFDCTEIEYKKTK